MCIYAREEMCEIFILYKDMDVVIGDDAIWEANDRHGRKLSMIRGIT